MSITVREITIQKGNKDGLGFVVTSQKPCIVSIVDDGSPACLAGLMVSDEIIEVNTINVFSFTHSEVVKLISNQKGNSLKLKVQNKTESDVVNSSSTSSSIFSNLNKLYNDFCSNVIFSSPNVSKKPQERSYEEYPTMERKDEDGFLNITTIPKIKRSKFNIERLSNRRNLNQENKISSERLRPKSLIVTKHETSNFSTQPIPKLAQIFELNNVIENGNKARNIFYLESPEKDTNYNAIVLFVCSFKVPTAADMFSACAECMERKVMDIKSNQTSESPLKVLLRMKGDGIQVLMHHDKKLIYHPSNSIFYTGVSSLDKQYFSFAITHGRHSKSLSRDNATDCEISNQFSCFLFKIDLELLNHELHDADLSPFGLCCSKKKNDCNCCPEFPCASSHVVEEISSFYIKSPFSKGRSTTTTDDECNYDEFAKSPEHKILSTALKKINGNALTPTHHNSKKLMASPPTSLGSITDQEKFKLLQEFESTGKMINRRDKNERECLMNDSGTLSDTLKRKLRLVKETNEFGARNQVLESGANQETSRVRDLQIDNKLKKIDPSMEHLLSVQEINTPPPSFLSGLRRGRRRSEGTALSPSLSLKDFFRSTFIGRMETPEVIVKRDVKKDSNGNSKRLSNGSSQDSLISIGRVDGWSRAFESLLADPVGIRCFQEFLRKEFSEENLLFWMACEKFKKTKDREKMRLLAADLFRNYLSPTGAFLVNVDQQAVKNVQENIDTPNHEMFVVPQEQVFQLMRFDSYQRFLKSNLYQECLQADIEKKILPFEDEIDEQDLKKKTAFVKKSKSYLIDNQERKKNLLNFLTKNDVRINEDDNAKMRKERSSSLSAVEEFCRLNSAMSPVCNGVTNRDNQLWDGSQVKSHCAFVRVRFPDGTSTIILAESGVTIRQSLRDVCQHKNIDFKSIDITVGETRQVVNPDGDICTFQDNVIYLEKRVLVRFDLPSGRSVGIKANPKKSVREVLHPVMKKNGFDISDYTVYVINTSHQISLDANITNVEGKRLVTRLFSKKLARQNSDIALGKPPMQDFRSSLRRLRSSSFKDEKIRSEKISTLERHQEKRSSVDHKGEETFHRKLSNEVKHLILGRTRSADDDGANALLNVLRKSQSGRLDDQRGMIKKDIEMPDFLKVTVNTPSTTRSIFKTTSSKSTPTKTSKCPSASVIHESKHEQNKSEMTFYDAIASLAPDKNLSRRSSDEITYDNLQSSETTLLRSEDDDIFHSDSLLSTPKSKTKLCNKISAPAAMFSNHTRTDDEDQRYWANSYNGNAVKHESLQRTMSATCRPKPLNIADESFILRELDRSNESSLLSPDHSRTSSSLEYSSSLDRRTNTSLVKSCSYHGPSSPIKTIDNVTKPNSLSLNISKARSTSFSSQTSPLIPLDIVSYDTSPRAGDAHRSPVFPVEISNKDKLPPHLFQTNVIPTPEKEKLLGGETIRGRQNEKITFV